MGGLVRVMKMGGGVPDVDGCTVPSGYIVSRNSPGWDVGKITVRSLDTQTGHILI